MQFFINAPPPEGELIWLEPEDAWHVFKVLRMKPGEHIRVYDSQQCLYLCQLVAVDKGGVSARVLSRQYRSTEPGIDVTVFAGLSKGDRFDWLIQKCVECGARHIVPFVSENCVIRLRDDDGAKKAQRFGRIAMEASKQSGRSRPVTVGDIVGFDEALSMAAEAGESFFLYEGEAGYSFRSALEECKEQASAFSIISGPEGGFSPREAQLAGQKGCKSVSIGPRILRCETAPVAALCAIMYTTGNFDIGE